MTLTDDERQRLRHMGGRCKRWVFHSRYLTDGEVAVEADACISELLTELVHGSRLAARWCDERSDALLRAEHAEAAAEKWNAANIAANRTIDSLVRERRTLRRLKQRAERERDRLNSHIRELSAKQDVPLDEGG